MKSREKQRQIEEKTANKWKCKSERRRTGRRRRCSRESDK